MTEVTTSDTKRTEPEYTIDELASAAGVPSRTIRFYQSKGVLPAPRIRGRVAYYEEHHVARLAMISNLQDRGLRIDAIREVLTRIDRGEVDFASWLGLTEHLRKQWTRGDGPRTVTVQQAMELHGERGIMLLDRLVERGAAHRNAAGDYIVTSPPLLDVGITLDREHINLDVADEALIILRKHLSAAAGELAQHFLTAKPIPEVNFGRAIAALQSSALEVVQFVFAQEIDQVLRQLISSGKTASYPRAQSEHAKVVPTPEPSADER